MTACLLGMQFALPKIFSTFKQRREKSQGTGVVSGTIETTDKRVTLLSGDECFRVRVFLMKTENINSPKRFDDLRVVQPFV